MIIRKLNKFLRLLQNPVFRRGLFMGVGATTEHASFLKSQNYAAVIDAGGNKGQFSLAARAYYPTAKILAFEPLPQPRLKFEKLFTADSNARLFDCALGAGHSEQAIHISRREDSSSLLPIGALQSEKFPGTEEIRTEVIRVEALDTVLHDVELPFPILLKIDVQGFEQQLLIGAQETLRRVDGIYVELSFCALYSGQPLADEIIGWLRERDFELAGIYNLSQDAEGVSVQADFFFRRKK